jgi:hypothetical protein
MWMCVSVRMRMPGFEPMAPGPAELAPIWMIELWAGTVNVRTLGAPVVGVPGSGGGLYAIAPA